MWGRGKKSGPTQTRWPSKERRGTKGRARPEPDRSDRGAGQTGVLRGGGWYKGREQHVGLRRDKNRALGPGKLSRGRRAGGKS